MKKIILVAGVPGIGKTYLSKLIIDQYPAAMYLPQDAIKELLYDAVGFSNEVEKEEIISKSRDIFYEICEMSLANNEVLILDYPFSYKQLEFLDGLNADYDIRFLTLALHGDLDVLYERRKERDLNGFRNKGHILDCYHGYETYDELTYPLSKKKYINACKQGGYDNFKYEVTIPIDVTDYSKVNYSKILDIALDFIKTE